MNDTKLVLIGLGNKGAEHKFNRHNIGFILIDSIKKLYDFSEFKEKNKMFISEGYIAKKKFTYVNLKVLLIVQA